MPSAAESRIVSAFETDSSLRKPGPNPPGIKKGQLLAPYYFYIAVAGLDALTEDSFKPPSFLMTTGSDNPRMESLVI